MMYNALAHIDYLCSIIIFGHGKVKQKVYVLSYSYANAIRPLESISEGLFV
nr:MAG TPA: hypothetical protein [Caudoviricetes sp.]